MRTSTLRFAVGGGTLLLGATLLAQAPLLQTSTPAMGARGWEVTLTNVYSSGATAFAIRIDTDGTGMGRVSGLHWEDAVPGATPSKIELAPGASRTLHLGSANMRGVNYTVAAVIYADGTSAGEPAVLRHLLKARELELAELPQVISILDQAVNDPAIDRAALLNQFQQRDATGREALRDHVVGPIDRVCSSVVATLSTNTDENVRAQVAALRDTFKMWDQQLSASLPKIGP